MPDSQENAAELRERVRDLEATVAGLTDRIEQDRTTVGRRSILASAAAAAGLGSLGTYGVQQASAQASGPAGQQGTADNPNDIFAWDLDVQNGATFNGTPLSGVGSLDVEGASINGPLDAESASVDDLDVQNSASVAAAPTNQTDVARLAEIPDTSALADDPHGNEAHDVNFSTTEPADVTSQNWGDFEIQKNGTDGNGIINFKTQ